MNVLIVISNLFFVEVRLPVQVFQSCSKLVQFLFTTLTVFPLVPDVLCRWGKLLRGEKIVRGKVVAIVSARQALFINTI